MADVRLTATNPEDSSVVPVACNEKGELKLEEPIVVEGPQGEQGEKGEKGEDGDPFTGNFEGDVRFSGECRVYETLNIGLDSTAEDNPTLNIGSFQRRGSIWGRSGGVSGGKPETFLMCSIAPDESKFWLRYSGMAYFGDAVTISSRGNPYTIHESNGIAHLIPYTKSFDDIEPDPAPVLRDVLGELTMVEQALSAVMEKLKMTPPAGWEVWDGSSENS